MPDVVHMSLLSMLHARTRIVDYPYGRVNLELTDREYDTIKCCNGWVSHIAEKGWSYNTYNFTTEYSWTSKQMQTSSQSVITWTSCGLWPRPLIFLSMVTSQHVAD